MAATDVELLDALIADQEKTIRDAFAAYVSSVGTDGPAFHAILIKLQEHDVEGAMAIVDSYVAQMGTAIPAVMHAVGAATATELAGLIPQQVVVGISFDPTFPRAAELIRDNSLRFVRDFSAQQRKATEQALVRAYQQGTGTASTARAFQHSIGLTPIQEQHVASYRALLEKGSRSALNRMLRDRRFDRSVERAASGGRALTPKQIDRMVNRYRERYLGLRAETIARTEGVRATSLAREESLDQMIQQTGIERARIERIWNAIDDRRTRDWHASMDGQKRGRDTPFQDGLGNDLMYPGDANAPAETVINCRCGLTFRVRPSV